MSCLLKFTVQVNLHFETQQNFNIYVSFLFQTACGSFMDIAIVLDGSNSIYPWEPIVAFLKKLLENLDIGPQSTQASLTTCVQFV